MVIEILVVGQFRVTAPTVAKSKLQTVPLPKSFVSLVPDTVSGRIFVKGVLIAYEVKICIT
jgi:hypothetical protein